MAASRIYLDWNASAPLRPEAREAMLAAMDAVGNPSSVHGEGRAARGIVETAREQVAALLGCDPGAVIFTSGATEAAALALHGRERVDAGPELHDALWSWNGAGDGEGRPVGCVQYASGETGEITDLTGMPDDWLFLGDAAQAAGKISFDIRTAMTILSAHKFGGPKGAGALVTSVETGALLRGGGQEGRKRAGTENLIGIAGFGAAAEAALRDLQNGVWEDVRERRDRLEAMICEDAPWADFIAADRPRLPNTSCFVVPGWAGDTQVMAMDLAGFAISSGPACASGKVERESRALRAMGFDAGMAMSAIRVSIGPTTTDEEITSFARAWCAACRKVKVKSA